MLWHFHISHWPNGLCHLGDDKCEIIAREVNYMYLWSHQIQDALGHNAYSSMNLFPFPLRQEGIHNHGRPRCIWCICGYSCTGSHFLAYAQVKVENLSSCWPTTNWLQLLLCQYQLIVACCNLFSCNGTEVLCMCWHITIIVAITVIMIVKWHWHLNAFNGQQC